MSALAKEVYRLLRVKKVSTAAYRPQTNGLVERFNRTLAAMLSMYVNSKHTDWDRYLPYVTFAYNTTAHSATKESPFFLLYGRQARMPIDNMLMPDSPHENQSVEEYRAELVEGLRLAHEPSPLSHSFEMQLSLPNVLGDHSRPAHNGYQILQLLQMAPARQQR